jgi:hypothetical protein
MTPRISALFTASVLFVLPAVATAQGELYHRDGRRPYSQFGSALARLGDVDGDGARDFAVAAPRDSRFGYAAGWVSLRSGTDGFVIWSVFGSGGEMLGDVLADAGDLNGDGIDDLLASAQGAGEVRVFSGADGSLVRTWTQSTSAQWFGMSVANLGDVNGDGIDDVAIGAPEGTKSGTASVYLYSGADGSLLSQIDHVGGEHFGEEIAAAGDLDLDGVPDLVVGGPMADPSGITNAGALHAYSLATNAVLFDYFGDQVDEELGGELASGVDLNGDGIPDVIFGAAQDSRVFESQGLAGAVSGADGSLLWQRLGTRVHDAYGNSLALSDVDGDGRAELLVGAGYDFALDVSFRVELLLPADGSLLHEWIEPPKDGAFGDEILALGDVDGDGTTDFAMGAPEQDDGTLSYPGSVFVYRGADTWLNATPKQLAAGDTLTTTIREGAASQLALRFVVDVNGTAFFVPLPPVATLDASGAATFVDVVPAGLAGNVVTLRAWTVGANGKLVATNEEAIELQ